MIKIDNDILLKYGVFGEKKYNYIKNITFFSALGLSVNTDLPLFITAIIPILAFFATKKGLDNLSDFFFDNNKLVSEFKDNYNVIINEIIELGTKLGLDNPIEYYALTEYLYNNGYLAPERKLRKFNVDGFCYLARRFKKEASIGNLGVGMERNLLLTDILINAGFDATFDVGNYYFNDDEDKIEILNHLIENDYFSIDDKQVMVNADSAPAFKAIRKLKLDGEERNFESSMYNSRDVRLLALEPNYILTKILIEDFYVYLDLYKDRYYRFVVGDKYISNNGNVFEKDHYESFKYRREYQLKDMYGYKEVSEEKIVGLLKQSDEVIKSHENEIKDNGIKIRRLTNGNVEIFNDILTRLV